MMGLEPTVSSLVNWYITIMLHLHFIERSIGLEPHPLIGNQMLYQLSYTSQTTSFIHPSSWILNES